jgi:hypothetical protein
MNSFKRLLQQYDRFMTIFYLSVICILVNVIVINEDILW